MGDSCAVNKKPKAFGNKRKRVLMRKVFVEELKSDIIYELTACNREIEGLGKIEVYGIKAYRGMKAEEVYHVQDISSLKEKVRCLLELFADHQLLPEHLEDTVNDYLGGGFDSFLES